MVMGWRDSEEINLNSKQFTNSVSIDLIYQLLNCQKLLFNYKSLISVSDGISLIFQTLTEFLVLM